MLKYILKHRALIIVLIVGIVTVSCQRSQDQVYHPGHEYISYSGRIDFTNPSEPVLAGSASTIAFRFEGENAEVLLSTRPGEGHNYFVVELDGKYMDRYLIGADTSLSFGIAAEQPGSHDVTIYKATESANGMIVFRGVKTTKLLEPREMPKRKIEFIGNSITCAMGADLTDLPCGEGVWYDQHNAFWSYGVQSARQLDAQFLLSSVSGIGIYRNWNSLSPVMPDVYDNLYLNTDNAKPYDFNSYIPDLVSICLGTNDLSLGDGKSERLPFDSTAYINAYVKFVENVFSKYPDVQVCLISSPMMGEGASRDILRASLQTVVKNVIEKFPEKKPLKFFDIKLDQEPGGCTYHPSQSDHQVMTEMLVPFYREVMNW